ncbi:MAG: metallophosphoesterase [Anaerolineae bacterium]|nr:metallophosphoesterase [Anaerolineae bacterium]
MTRAAWLTDIHLNFLKPVQLEKFYQQIKQAEPDCVLISGDIGEAPRLKYYLQQLESRLPYPIYFVLGNHDYYGASIENVDELVREMTDTSPHLHWLTIEGVVELSPTVGLIGHDGWADGRYGDYAASTVMLNDYLAIRDFVGMTKVQRLALLNSLGDAAARYVLEWLPVALTRYDHVFFMTHVPPFTQACLHEGQSYNDEWLPHYASKAIGDALIKVMRDYPKKTLTVLCGHTHGRVEAHILDNLLVMTGGAEYSRPEVQRVFEM